MAINKWNKRRHEHARKHWSWALLRDGAIHDLIESISSGSLDPHGTVVVSGYGMVAAALDGIPGSPRSGPSDEDVSEYIDIMSDVAVHDFGFEGVWQEDSVIAAITLESGFFGGDIDQQEIMLLLEAFGEAEVFSVLSHPSDWFKAAPRREFIEQWLVEADQILSRRYSPATRLTSNGL